MQEIYVDEAGRLDIFLAKCLQKSRSQVAQLIKNGGVKCNGVSCEKNSFKLKMGDKLEVIEFALNFAAQNLAPNFTQNLTNQNSKPNFSPQNFTPNFALKYPINFDIAVLYEDSEVLVLNKPAGVVVHSAPSVREATLVDWLLAKGYALSNLGGQLRAGLVHRLDKGTSGALIIAKNNAAHESLCKQLQNRALGRFYLALTDLPLKEDIICVEKPLIHCPKNRLKKLAVSGFVRGARTAKTAFANVLCGRDFGLNSTKNSNPNSNPNLNKILNINLIAAKLFTGRTHQIRAHLESLNRHILGDKLYGYKGKDYERVMLHAYFLYFTHPKTGEEMLVKAPLFEDFKQILNHFDEGELYEKLSATYIKRLFSAVS